MTPQLFNAVLFEPSRAEWRVDSLAHPAKENPESCSSCGVDEREKPSAIPLFAAFLHERTDPELAHRCIPSAGLRRVVLPRLGIPAKTGARPGMMRMRNSNRSHPLYQARRPQDGTRRGIPGRHPKRAHRRCSKMPGTCRLALDRLLSGIGFASSSWPNI